MLSTLKTVTTSASSFNGVPTHFVDGLFGARVWIPALFQITVTECTQPVWAQVDLWAVYDVSWLLLWMKYVMPHVTIQRPECGGS